MVGSATRKARATSSVDQPAEQAQGQRDPRVTVASDGVAAA